MMTGKYMQKKLIKLWPVRYKFLKAKVAIDMF